jgi:exosortase/archaeosortase family protein
MSWVMVLPLSVPAELQGHLVHLPSGTFDVGDDCAGLNYLLAAVAISLVYAQVLVRGRRSRVLTVLLAAVIALVGNWLRVAGLVLVGHLSEMKAGLIADHVAYGFVIFGFGMLLFFYLAPRLERVADKAAGSKGAGITEEPGVGAPDSGDTIGRAVPALIGGGRRAATATALAVLGPVLLFSVRALPAAQTSIATLADIADGVGWEVTDSGAGFEWSPAFRGAQDHERVWFTDGIRRVAGDRFVYTEQRPEAKLIGWPNRIAQGDAIVDDRVIGHSDGVDRRLIRQAVVRTEDGAMLVWYWYRVGGRDTFSKVHAKALEVPAFLQRRRSSELIAFSTLCGPTDCAEAYVALSELVPVHPAVETQPLHPAD